MWLVLVNHQWSLFLKPKRHCYHQVVLVLVLVVLDHLVVLLVLVVLWVPEATPLVVQVALLVLMTAEHKIRM